ncbi:MAG: hypothetical protein V2A73_10530 [Pseudomonadota bacterium]
MRHHSCRLASAIAGAALIQSIAFPALANEPLEDPMPGTLVVESSTEAQYAAGARLRYVFLPESVLRLFLQQATSMSSWGVGAEIVRRRGQLDLVLGFEYDQIAPENGLYLERGDSISSCSNGDGGQCPDYVEFENFGLLSVDLSVVWHANITPWLSFRYGTGIGIGAVLGKIVQTDTQCSQGTTLGSLDDPLACQRLHGTAEEADVPPVVPIINATFGLKAAVSPRIWLSLDAGFRNMFFVGLGGGYTM